MHAPIDDRPVPVGDAPDLAGFVRCALGLGFHMAWVRSCLYSSTVTAAAGAGHGGDHILTSMVAAALVCLVAMVAARSRWGARFEGRPTFGWAAAAVACAGTLLLGGWVRLGSDDGLGLAAGAVLAGLGFVAMSLLWGSRMATYDAGAIELYAPVAFVLSHLLLVPLAFTPPTAASLAVAALPLAAAASYAVACRAAAADLGPANHGQAVQGASGQGSPTPWGRGALAACAVFFLLRLWHGALRALAVGQPLPSGALFTWVQLLLPIVIFAAFISVALTHSRSLDVSLAVAWTLPLLLAATGFLCLGSPLGAWLGQMASTAALMVLQAFFYILFAKAAQGSQARGFALFLLFDLALSLGLVGGTLAVDGATAAVGRSAVLGAVVPASAVVVGAVMLFERVAGPFGAQVPAPAAPSALAAPVPCDDMLEAANRQRVRRLAEAYGLSPREEDIAFYLVAGRNRPYIRDVLGISLNTVHTHVKSIYGKLCIHSQQELIELASGK